MLVVQILTLGMDVRREAIVSGLVDVFAPNGIYERSDVPVRELEGLEQRTGVLHGDCPRHVRITENGLLLEVDIEKGQKNRTAPAPFNASGKQVTFPYWDGATVLECFSHTGSFTLHSCQYGAKKVTCLDISEHAIESARRNVALNGFEDRVEFVVADAFDYLRQQTHGLDERRRRGRASAGTAAAKIDTSKPLPAEGRTWEVVILDPPAFAKNRQAVEGACRGYKDINLHGMKLVNEGGFLVTASVHFSFVPTCSLRRSTPPRTTPANSCGSSSSGGRAKIIRSCSASMKAII